MKRVVVIGGGFVGACAVRKLQHDFQVTLIDTKDYLEFTPGILRVLVEPRHINKVQVRHEDYLKEARLIIGKVTEISPRHVVVKGKKIKFDYLIIASGSRYSAPIKHSSAVSATRARSLESNAAQLEKAKNIVIVGGGIVGVELAAEICTKYTDKEITVIHAGDMLIERNHSRAANYAQKFLEKRGVDIVLGEKAIKQTKGYVATDKRRMVKADLVFLCTGIVPNYEFMKKQFYYTLSGGSWINVDSFLRVIGTEHIFAGGDVAAIKEEKTAQAAEKHSRIIARNIQNLENKKPLIAYRSRKIPMVISLGKWNGIFEYGNIVWTGLVPAFMKSVIEWKTMRRYLN